MIKDQLTEKGYIIIYQPLKKIIYKGKTLFECLDFINDDVDADINLSDENTFSELVDECSDQKEFLYDNDLNDLPEEYILSIKLHRCLIKRYKILYYDGKKAISTETVSPLKTIIWDSNIPLSFLSSISGIPKRTLEDWERFNKCPRYIIYLLKSFVVLYLQQQGVKEVIDIERYRDWTQSILGW